MIRYAANGGVMKPQQKFSLLHLLFLIGLTSTPTALTILGWRELGSIGAFLGIALGVPLGALIGYAPYWITRQFLRVDD